MPNPPAPALPVTTPLPPTPGGIGGRWLIRAAPVVAILGWLWPIGAGGRMPVGGDATQFSIGLMAFLGGSLRAGRWPTWNDLWGFGFPALAESQMGVYYPIHWLYGVLSTETAYVVILAAHFIWAALGAAWLARRLGVSESGAALAGFSWAGSGFFLIHLPHQWAYTVGSWMPWAWGLAWSAVRAPGRAGRRPAWALAAVLAVQILPGHFQMAFITEVGALVLAILGSGRGRGRGLLAVAAAVGSAFLLAAAQVEPTLVLARVADGERGFEYLSGFAAAPVHLVSFVAPGLFHRSPLWRPLAWDLFHTAPEEYLGSIGLVPLFLAVRALGGWRRSVEVRALVGVGVVTLLLALGPYAPGFRLLIELPGFSFFRAPARWIAGSSLALAVLAGIGFDRVRLSGWGRRGVLGSAAAAVLGVGVVVGGIELALAATRGPGWPAVLAGFDRAIGALPWPNGPDFRSVIRAASRPQDDLRVRAAQARLDGLPFPPGGLALDRERWGIYARELAASGATLLAFAGVGLALGRRPRALAWGLGVLSVADLVAQGQARPFDLGPIRSLAEQSPILARVAARPRGFRTLDPAQNLFQVVGGNPATAYHTLTLEAPDRWLGAARQVDADHEAQAAAALRAAGIDARVLDPFEVRSVPPDWHAGDWGRPLEPVRDPALAGWLFGADFARLNHVETFGWVEARAPTPRAWLLHPDELARGTRDDSSPAVVARARPLPLRSDGAGELTIPCDLADGDSADRIYITSTCYMGWIGRWVDPAGVTRPAAIERAPNGLTVVSVAPLAWPGPWTLHLSYHGETARRGLVVSALAWASWIGLGVRGRRERRRAAIDGRSGGVPTTSGEAGH